MCTLVAEKMDLPGSLLFKKDTTSLASENITHSLLDHKDSCECSSWNLCMGCVFTCRRSPRLLTNGYYVLTEDSFLFDEDGNVTLSPSQTSVTYKEKLVRIFRKRKRIRRSLVSLFNMDSSRSWLNSTMIDSPHGEDTWFEGDCKMDEAQCHGNGAVEFAWRESAEKAEQRRRPSSTPCSSAGRVSTKSRGNIIGLFAYFPSTQVLERAAATSVGSASVCFLRDVVCITDTSDPVQISTMTF